MKIVRSSDDKDMYFNADSITPHRDTLIALGYTIEEINLIGFDAYKHMAYKAYNKDDGDNLSDFFKELLK